MSHQGTNGASGNNGATSSASPMAPPSPSAAFPDSDTIDNFWPPEPRSVPAPASTSYADTNAATSTALAVEAARTDPFRNARNASASTSSPSPAVSNNRPAYASNYNAPAKGFSSQLAMYPGQGQAREIGKPVSAVRTAENNSNGYHETEDPQAEQPQLEDTGLVDDQSQVSHSNQFTAPEEQTPMASAVPYREDLATPTTPGASDADTSMMSQQGLGSTQKKRKTFKYLQDEPQDDGSSQQRTEKRKKVQKACRPCKRSHMPCESQRPCPRCIKRGIPELCIDAEPIVRRTTRKSAAGPSNAAATTSDAPDDASEIEQLAKAAEAMRSPSDAVSAHASTSSHQALAQSAPRNPPRVYCSDLEMEQAEALQKALISLDPDYLDLFGGHPLSLLADPTLGLAALGDDLHETTPFSHTRSYSRLARWAIEQLPDEMAAELDIVTGSARGRFLQSVQHARLDDLQSIEEAFQQALQEMQQQNVLDAMPVPVFVARRSGEVYASNAAGLQLIGRSEGDMAFTGGRMNLIQLGHGRRALEIAKLLTNSQVLAMGETTSAAISIDPSVIRQLVEATEQEQGLSIGAEDPGQLALPVGQERNFIVSIKTRHWRDGLPLIVTCTLTPLPARV